MPSSSVARDKWLASQVATCHRWQVASGVSIKGAFPPTARTYQTFQSSLSLSRRRALQHIQPTPRTPSLPSSIVTMGPIIIVAIVVAVVIVAGAFLRAAMG